MGLLIRKQATVIFASFVHTESFRKAAVLQMKEKLYFVLWGTLPREAFCSAVLPSGMLQIVHTAYSDQSAFIAVIFTEIFCIHVTTYVISLFCI